MKINENTTNAYGNYGKYVKNNTMYIAQELHNFAFSGTEFTVLL